MIFQIQKAASKYSKYIGRNYEKCVNKNFQTLHPKRNGVDDLKLAIS